MKNLPENWSNCENPIVKKTNLSTGQLIGIKEFLNSGTCDYLSIKEMLSSIGDFIENTAELFMIDKKPFSDSFLKLIETYNEVGFKYIELKIKNNNNCN